MPEIKKQKTKTKTKKNLYNINNVIDGLWIDWTQLRKNLWVRRYIDRILKKQKEQRLGEKKQNIQGLRDKYKRYNMGITGKPEEEEEKKQRKHLKQ